MNKINTIKNLQKKDLKKNQKKLTKKNKKKTPN